MAIFHFPWKAIKGMIQTIKKIYYKYTPNSNDLIDNSDIVSKTKLK